MDPFSTFTAAILRAINSFILLSKDAFLMTTLATLSAPTVDHLYRFPEMLYFKMRAFEIFLRLTHFLNFWKISLYI